MAAINVLKTRDTIIGRGICPDTMAETVAVFADEVLDEAIEPLARKDTLEALIEQWRTERAEIAAQQAQFMAEIRKEISDFREENNLRERESRRTRASARRTRLRARDQEERDSKTRNWVLVMIGIGFAAVSTVTGLIVAFG